MKQRAGKLPKPLSSLSNPSSPLSSPFSPSSSLPSLLCILLILAFAVFFSALAIQQHRTFQTNGLDLGNVDQALWNTAQGRFLQFTLMTPIESRVALHVEPLLLLFVPLYWVGWGGPEILLIIQASVAALGAWPLYQMARMELFSGREKPYLSLLLLVFPLAYLLYPSLEAAVLFEFHTVTLVPTLILFAFWAWGQKRNKLFIIFLVLAMATKEDMALLVVMVGLVVGLARQRWRLAGLLLLLGISWFGLAVFFIQPLSPSGGNIQFDRYTWLGDDPVEMVQTIITQPSLVFDHLWHQANAPRYLGQLLFPTAFLALFSPLLLLPMLPTLAINLLSTHALSWRLEEFHYGAPLVPFVFMAAIFGLKRISSLGGRGNLRLLQPVNIGLVLTLLLLVFSGIYHYYRGFTPLARPFDWPPINNHHRHLAQVLATIPPDSALFTQSNLAPHLTHRQNIFIDFAYFTDPTYPAPVPVADIVLDVTGFENIGGLHQFLRQELLASGDYEVVTAQDGILHLRPLTTGNRPPATNHRPPTIDDAPLFIPYSLLPTPFYSFAQPDTPPAYRIPVDFGEALRLRGYTLHFDRQAEVQVTVDLEPLQPLPADIQPVLYLLDSAGQPVGATTDLQPTVVWFPPEQWQVGETVRIRFNTLPWYTRQTEVYGLALGVVDGSDVWNGYRYRPTLTAAGEFATRLPAGGSLIELARIEQVGGMPEGGPWQRRFDAPGLTNSFTANFADQIKLLGHSTPEIEGQHLTLDLVWQAVKTPENLIRFGQLVGPDGQVYGQNDSVPDHGNYPTSLWQPGEVVVETVTFPLQPERPEGIYTLHLGFYRPADGQRVPLISGGDHLEINVE